MMSKIEKEKPLMASRFVEFDQAEDEEEKRGERRTMIHRNEQFVR